MGFPLSEKIPAVARPGSGVLAGPISIVLTHEGPHIGLTQVHAPTFGWHLERCIALLAQAAGSSTLLLTDNTFESSSCPD